MRKHQKRSPANISLILIKTQETKVMSRDDSQEKCLVPASLRICYMGQFTTKFLAQHKYAQKTETISTKLSPWISPWRVFLSLDSKLSFSVFTA